MKLEHPMKRRDTSAWTIAIIAFALLACVAFTMLAVRQLDVTRGVVGAPGMFPYRGTITSLEAIVDESIARSLGDRDVLLANTEIAEVRGDRVFLLEARGQRVPVVTFEPVPETFARGEHVRIHGTLRLAAKATGILGYEELSPGERGALRDHALFISAHRVVPRERPRIAKAEVPRVITAVSQLAKFPDPDALQARDVVLERVRVVRVLGDYTFLVGNGATQVPVVVFGELTARQADSAVTIDRGDHVRIYGVVRRLYDVQEIEDVLMLSRGEAEQLREHAVYISAFRIVELGPSS